MSIQQIIAAFPPAPAGPTVIILTSADTSPWTVPADFNPANNTIEAIGGGASGGGIGVGNVHGGGAGAYATLTNFDPDSATEIDFEVGLGGTPGNNGGDTSFKRADVLLARGGNNTGSGGLAAACAPAETAHNGGDGWLDIVGSQGGGGGAGGPNGDGQSATSSTGGNGAGPNGGAGGVGSANGGNGTTWRDTATLTQAGPGGGGGGTGDPPGNGGQCGGGGGGGLVSDGTGGEGVIVITYVPITPSSAIVSGAGSPEVDGEWTYREMQSGRPAYGLVGGTYPSGDFIAWNGGAWTMNSGIVGDAYSSADDVAFPWLATWTTSDGSPPAPTVTEGP